MSKISKKQQQIVDTARDLFFRYGVKRVTVEEICQTAHVSKMTFYKYFTNKTELAKHIILQMFHEGWQRLDEVEAMSIPFPEKLQKMLDYKLDVTAQVSSDFIEEYLTMPFFEHERQKWLARVMQFLTDAQQRGDIRPEVRPEFILVMADKLQEVIEDARLKSLYPSYIELTRELWNFFYYGIVTRNPLETS
jgi:AcrR family transcriptional regulator